MSDARASRQIAALMTCHNRRDLTVRCLTSLRAQAGPFTLDLFLVDDGSSDETAAAARQVWPEARVLAGDGTLFWNGGMRLAWETAAAAARYDHYLWLNDDVELAPGALDRLVREAEACAGAEGAVIVCGSTCRANGGELSYGGQRRTNPRRPLRFALIEPGPKPGPADTISGNIVLVSAAAFKRVGNLSPAFVHIFGDVDYGLRARSEGIPVMVGSGYFGACEGPDMRGSSLDAVLGRRRRLRLRLAEERKVHARDWRIFARRHSGLGPLSILYALPPYWRILRGK